MRERAEERDNRLEGGDVGGGGAGLHRVQVNVPVMQDHEEILVACRRSDREAPGQIGGSPFGSVEGEGVSVERGVKGIGGDRGKSRDEGSVWGGSLFAFVVSCLSCLGGGRHARGVRRRRGLRDKRGSSEAGGGGESFWWRPRLAAAGQDDQMLWRERGEGTCARGWRLVGESRGYIHGTGRGGRWRERGSQSSGEGRRRSGLGEDSGGRKVRCEWG